MSVGVIGEQVGMSRLFTEEGKSIPVTVVKVVNRIGQLKTDEIDGYRAVQVVAGHKKANRMSDPIKGHLAKAGVEAGAVIKEFRLDLGENFEGKLGDEITVEQFVLGQKVDVSGVSKGKGFAGVVKRHNFQMQDATHGNSLSHRAHGSVGQCQTPGRVRKGKKMAGRMGNANCTVQSLEVVKIVPEKSLIMIKGAVPGAPGGYVVITPSVKNKGKSQ